LVLSPTWWILVARPISRLGITASESLRRSA
jgi:hypothetical protein